MNIEHEIEIVNALPSLYPLQDYEEEAINTIIKEINESMVWIPCKDRLPTKQGEYYVTELVYDICDKKHERNYSRRTAFATYYPQESKWGRAKFIEVVAWMESNPWKG